MTVAPVRADVPIQVFGLGAVEAQTLSRIGFETAGPLSSLTSTMAMLSRQAPCSPGCKAANRQRVAQAKAAVLAFLAQARQGWSTFDWVAAEINGGRSIILRRDGVTTASISFAYDERGTVTRIYIMRNPDKLSRLHEARRIE